MSAPRYVPRSVCAEPDGFGKASGVRWVAPTDEQSAALVRAARLQHLYAVRIRTRAKAISNGTVPVSASGPLAARPGADTTPLKTLAKLSGRSYPTLLRCLRGEVVMRLEDIAWADLVLGEISEQAQPPAAAPPIGQRLRPPGQ
ncbi:MAG: hypothetical protein LH624_01485 [Cryobacterium sp.]|nr:hypothetical protein [Cryobacterium sp.]